MPNTFDAAYLTDVPADLEDIVGAFDFDYSIPAQASLARRIDAAADALERAGIVETREDAIAYLSTEQGELDPARLASTASRLLHAAGVARQQACAVCGQVVAMRGRQRHCSRRCAVVAAQRAWAARQRAVK